MNLHFTKYSATGNIIGVAYYSDIFNIEKFINDFEVRKNLKNLATKNNCDSVMVLIKTKGNEPNLETIVFEPNNGDECGTFSVMCGNGVRAVADYAHEYLNFSNWPLLLKTKSGTLKIEKLSNKTYHVFMGNIVTDKVALNSYVNPRYFPENTELADVGIPQSLLQKIKTLSFSKNSAVCSIGFSTSENNIYKTDGEPHIMIELNNLFVRTLKELKEVAKKYGSIICYDKKIFPLGMNVNFVIQNKQKDESFFVCTFERNLGDNPEKSVTQACGTGCTFVGAEQMRKLKTKKIIAQCLGGNLVIEEKNNSVYMSGDVVRLN